MFEYRDTEEVDLRAKIRTNSTNYGNSSKFSSNSLPISDDDSGFAVLDEYAWVPPGLTPKQVLFITKIIRGTLTTSTPNPTPNGFLSHTSKTFY